jgi:uncharacterized protein (DUF1810 family)
MCFRAGAFYAKGGGWMDGVSFDLDRFEDAQRPVFDTVLSELRGGRKRSHWIWFIFPQMRGLGRSATSEFYGIGSLAEARAYIAHPVLGPRLLLCTETVLGIVDRSLNEIFGSPDDMKFRSSMTLFARAIGERPNVFTEALDRYCGGGMDEKTLALLGEKHH